MRYEGKKFKNAVLNLDGHEYVNCEFEDCTLVVAASEGFLLEGNDMRRPRFHFAGAAARTAAVISHLHRIGAIDAVKFLSLRAPDDDVVDN